MTTALFRKLHFLSSYMYKQNQDTFFLDIHFCIQVLFKSENVFISMNGWQVLVLIFNKPITILTDGQFKMFSHELRSPDDRSCHHPPHGWPVPTMTCIVRVKDLTLTLLLKWKHCITENARFTRQILQRGLKMSIQFHNISIAFSGTNRFFNVSVAPLTDTDFYCCGELPKGVITRKLDFLNWPWKNLNAVHLECQIQ